jgi:glycosyltransferase involved in cell wall biosynthesis
VRVLYFGTYERHYPRNAQVISALREAGVEVVEHHVPVWEGREHKFRLGARAALKLAGAELRLLRRPRADFDAIIVGYPGHVDMLPARRAARRRPIVFNPLVSLEDTIVGDRRLTTARSPRGMALRAVDRLAFRRADLVVADTAAQGRYFGDRFGLSEERVAVCYVGAEDRLFHPGERGSNAVDALFVGKLIPLHGIETILAAAKLCPEISFRLVGSGQLDGLLDSRPVNVDWVPWVEYEHLPALYRSAACALGIFGTSDKAARVIPNKAFQALATATPLITADTAAARELLATERDAILVPPGRSEALAAAVRRVVGDPELQQRIGGQGRETYEKHASETALGSRWREKLEELVRRTT